MRSVAAPAVPRPSLVFEQPDEKPEPSFALAFEGMMTTVNHGSRDHVAGGDVYVVRPVLTRADFSETWALSSRWQVDRCLLRPIVVDI